jgi:hypothetical protein
MEPDGPAGLVMRCYDRSSHSSSPVLPACTTDNASVRQLLAGHDFVSPQERQAESVCTRRAPVARGRSWQCVRADENRPQVRSALRKSKQLLEAGEVLTLEPVPHGERADPRRGRSRSRYPAGGQGGHPVKAVTWRGVNKIGVETVEDPRIVNDHDIILQVGLTANLRLRPAPPRWLHPGDACRRRARA